MVFAKDIKIEGLDLCDKEHLRNTHWTVNQTRLTETNQHIETDEAAMSYAILKKQCRELRSSG